MNKIRLFIEEQEIELQEEVQVSITRQLEELTNPTVICNDYTKTVKIPMTSQNNQIFGNIYSPDRITVDQPDNLLLNMTNGNELTMSGNFFHTDKEYPVQYGHPEFLYPETLYNQYWPTEVSMSSISGYTVYRGVPSVSYGAFIPETTDLGRKGFTFTLSSSNTGTQRYLTLRVNGTPSSLGGLVPYVVFDLTDFENGTYSFSFETVKFDTASKEVDIKNVVLAKSDKVVWMEDVINPFGIYFDPMKKLNFRLEWNGDILMQGYTKLLAAKQENGKGYYEVTLNGEIGKIFQELKKITFDPSVSGDTENSKYYIDGSQYVSTAMSKELVYSAWTAQQSTYNILSTYCKITDILGFAPCNAFDDGFDYTTYQDSVTSSKKFTDALNDVNFSGLTKIDPETVIPDGMTPRGIGEYRSYLQQPYIYFNKLFQIFKIKSEQLTGYKFDLDSGWFVTTNPHWFRTVTMLKKLDMERNRILPELVTYADSSKQYHYNFAGQSNLQNFDYNATAHTVTVNVSTSVRADLSTSISVKIRNNSVFTINVYATNRTSTQRIGLIAIKDSGSSYTPAGTTNIVNVAETSIPSGTYPWILVDGSYTFSIPTSLTGDIQFYWTFGGYCTEAAFTGSLFVYNNGSGYSSIDLGNIVTAIADRPLPLVNFTLNDLWNNDYNLFDIIINYCRMYRIMIKADPYDKTLKFIRSDTYFRNGGNPIIDDWTDKVCMDKDYTLKPITWEHKYVLFNYEDSETKIGEEYRDKYGADWGEKRLVTDYTFNTETDELFSGITAPLINTDYVLSWKNLYENRRIMYSFPAETSVCMADKDGKYVPQFGAMYFDRGRYSFDTSDTLEMMNVVLTDDTEFQRLSDTFFYNPTVDYKFVTLYPKLDVVYSNYMCTFGKPMENYTYQTTAYDNKTTIYDMVWKKYVEERYNKNNKVLTCYVHLTPYDYINFDFNHFVKIENQLYVVNKIYDYDAVTNQKVKVDLITVQDITGYTSR